MPFRTQGFAGTARIDTRARRALRPGHPLIAALIVSGLIGPAPAGAQDPTKHRALPVIPDFTPAPLQPRDLLPALARPEALDLEALAAGARIRVRQFRIIGNTRLSAQIIASITRGYLDRPLGYVDLQRLRDALTRAYIERGYVTSGVLLPQQSIREGIIEFQAIEGRLTTIEVEPTTHFDAAYFIERLQRSADPVVNIVRIENRLQLLRQDPRIGAIRAQLMPAAARGESTLRLAVDERSPWHLSAQVDNHTAPAIGAEGLRLRLSHDNVSGWADRLDLDAHRTEGLQEAALTYRRALNSADTEIELHLRGSRSEIVDSAFSDLDIESSSRGYGIRLLQPLQQAPDSRLGVYGGLDRRRSESFLLGSGFSFVDGPEEGLAQLTALRAGVDWVRRDARQVGAVHVRLSTGLDAFDATRNDGPTPDGQFTSILTQLQWVRRLPWRQSRLILRGDLQLSDSRLLGMEQFSMGGHASVRGYREHELVRDQGAFVSAELRIPIRPDPAYTHQADFALFADAAHGRNQGSEPVAQDLYSLGLGISGRFLNRWHYQLQWAEALRAVVTGGDHDWQDDGLHLSLSYRWPGALE